MLAWCSPSMCEDEGIPAGHIEVGSTADGQHVIVNHPDLDVDDTGCGHILFSPAQAREFARLLVECADECDVAQISRC